MRITYDAQVHASYVYFTPIAPGGVANMLVDHPLDVDFDDQEQIIAFKLPDSDKSLLQNRLQYALQSPEVEYDAAGNGLTIAFASAATVKQTISWTANLDLDQNGQILGIEILFADPDYESEDDQTRLYADGKLDHVSRYIVSFDLS